MTEVLWPRGERCSLPSSPPPACSALFSRDSSIWRSSAQCLDFCFLQHTVKVCLQKQSEVWSLGVRRRALEQLFGKTELFPPCSSGLKFIPEVFFLFVFRGRIWPWFLAQLKTLGKLMVSYWSDSSNPSDVLLHQRRSSQPAQKNKTNFLCMYIRPARDCTFPT